MSHVQIAKLLSSFIGTTHTCDRENFCMETLVGHAMCFVGQNSRHN
jgi:hypothetical protein